jgi:hypothetical protein
MKETGFDSFQSEIEELLLEIDRTTEGKTAGSSKKRKNEDEIDPEHQVDGKREFKDA